MIDGIAFQTNILALNAAVEAARAGKDRHGFAVAAAREIRTLTNRSVSPIAHSNTLVKGTGVSIQEIGASVKALAALMEDISSASAEQSTGIEQVNLAVTHMDAAT